TSGLVCRALGDRAMAQDPEKWLPHRNAATRIDRTPATPDHPVCDHRLAHLLCNPALAPAARYRMHGILAARRMAGPVLPYSSHSDFPGASAAVSLRRRVACTTC